MKNALNIILLANLEGEKRCRWRCGSECVRSNRYTEWKLVDKVETLTVTKQLFCVKKNGKFGIFFNFFNEHFKDS